MRDAQFVSSGGHVREPETPFRVGLRRAQDGLLRVDEIDLRSGDVRAGSISDHSRHHAATALRLLRAHACQRTEQENAQEET
jgi:hypothetical protein